MAILEFAETLENNDVDIGVVCIMSHGEEDSIETADNLTVKIEADILNRFGNSYCPSMIGKPKLFLFQACRGDEVDPGMSIKMGTRSAVTDSVKKVPTTLNDSIMAFSTIPHHVAYRKSEGSPFIKIVCEVFQSYDH